MFVQYKDDFQLPTYRNPSVNRWKILHKLNIKAIYMLEANSKQFLNFLSMFCNLTFLRVLKKYLQENVYFFHSENKKISLVIYGQVHVF